MESGCAGIDVGDLRRVTEGGHAVDDSAARDAGGRRSALRWPSTISMLSAGLLCISSPLAAQIRAGSSVLVSVGQRQAAHTEIFVATDPRDARRIAVCSMLVDPARNRLTSALYLSTDRGASWRLAARDTASRYGNSWDPACAVAADGGILFATLPSASDPAAPRVDDVTRVQRSIDGGRTWSVRDSKWIDNEDLAVDRSGGPHAGRVFIVGARLADTVPGNRHVAIVYSDDDGATFDHSVDVLPADGTRQSTVGAPVVAADGRLLVPVIVRRNPSADTTKGNVGPATAVAVLTGRDGGTRFDPPARVAPLELCEDNAPPVMAVDATDGPFRNRMYVVWADAAFGRCQIRLSWSDDGEHWSAPLDVDDPPVPVEPGVGPDAFMPEVGVNDDGIVGISWYDRREDPANRAFRQRFTASADGGASVLRSIAVSPSAYTYAQGQRAEMQFPLGHTFGTDSTGSTWLGIATGRANRTYYEVGDYGGLGVRADGTFQPVWIDNRSGAPLIYTATVNVTARARTPAQRDAALGEVVSDSVAMTLTRTVFDAASCTIDFGLDLFNRAARPLALPLLVRVDQMLSQMGVPNVPGDDEDDMGRPIWRAGGEGHLDPGATVSVAKRIGLDECRPLAGRGRRAYRQSLDGRFRTIPPSRIAGPSVLALRLRVFERSASRER